MAINRIKTGGITDGTIQSGDLAPGTIASDRIAPGTIANDRLANNSITINGTSIALGASGEIVAGTDWQAVTVADGSTQLNAVAGKGYLLDTNTGVIEVFLPTSPTRGDTIILVDYAGTFATNQVIVNTGTTNLDSTTTREYKLTTNDTIAEFVYIDSAKGWITKINTTAGTTPSGTFNESGTYDGPQYIAATGGTVATSGDYKIHTFTGDGCFVVSCGGNATGSNSVDYLVVAGGGGAGGDQGGGGGGGGFRLSSSTYCSAIPIASPSALPVSVTTYPITVGGGGAARPYCAGTNCQGNSGSPSIFSTITSAGGGGGAGNGPAFQALPGGSGGGSRHGNTPGGSGNTPPVSPPQGNPGGNSPGSNGSGGGGGATASGGDSPGSGSGGAGGAGGYMPTSSLGPAAPSLGESGPLGRYFSGGGAGGWNLPTGVISPGGGLGGGGDSSPGAGGAGTANTGGGGGGGNDNCTGGAGGKGIVVLRYKFQ